METRDRVSNQTDSFSACVHAITERGAVYVSAYCIKNEVLLFSALVAVERVLSVIIKVLHLGHK